MAFTWLILPLVFPTMAATAYAPILAGRASTMRNYVTTALQEDDSLDVPGILWLEHLNLVVGDKETSLAFFRDVIGCVVEPGKFHLNLGSQQLHL